jgi:hypothetical protein
MGAAGYSIEFVPVGQVAVQDAYWSPRLAGYLRPKQVINKLDLNWLDLVRIWA